MSAGGLSYSGITNFGKVTLPSVETWGTNNNILQDPPSSIHTRRKDKVGETSDITTMIDDSGNRFCEAINVYARGTNPSVSVSFGNYGSNSGGLSGNLTGLGSSHTQAYSPFTIMKDGAFRPPIVPPEQLLPFSRQPRVWTEVMSKPGFIDYTKKVREYKENCKLREIKNEKIEGSIPSTFSSNIYKNKPNHQSVQNNIQNNHNIQVDSKFVLPDSVIQNIGKQKTNIIDDVLKASANTNPNNRKKFIQNNNTNAESYVNKVLLDGELRTNDNLNIYKNNNELQTERFLQDPLNKEVETVLVSTGETNSNIFMNTDRFLQDANNIDVTTNQITTGETNANTVLDSKRFLQNNLNVFAQSNSRKNIRSDEASIVKETNSYLQSRNLIEATTNVNSNCNTTSIDDIADLGSIKLQSPLIIEKEGNFIKTGGQNYLHSEIELDKNLPNYQFETSKIQNKLQRNINPDKLKKLSRKSQAKNGIINNSGITGTQILSRNVNLHDTIKAGEFIPNHFKPSQSKLVNEKNVTLKDDKNYIEKQAINFNNRFESGLKRF
jgi:hypothetical protein